MSSLYIFLIFAFVFGCSNPSENSGNTTFFNGTRNGQSWVGDGVALSRGDSSLHILGMSGNYGLHQQIGILIEEPTSGSAPIDSGKARMIEIIEGDGVRTLFESQGQTSDFINFDWNKQEAYVTGNFKFSGLAQNSNTMSLEGEFNIEVEESSTPWDCGFLRRKPTDEGCRFIK